jgi:hypothetical protein
MPFSPSNFSTLPTVVLWPGQKSGTDDFQIGTDKNENGSATFQDGTDDVGSRDGRSPQRRSAVPVVGIGGLPRMGF